MTNKLIVHGLMKIDNKYLIIKRTKFKRGKPNVSPLVWDIPGGLVEDGELPQEALMRECKEEVGLNVKVIKILYEDSNIDFEKNCTFTRLTYLCEVTNQGEKDIILQLDEHSEYKLINNLEQSNNEVIASFVKEALNVYIKRS